MAAACVWAAPGAQAATASQLHVSGNNLAWTWNTWSGGCSSGPVLITNYNGTPTNYGVAYKAHLASVR